MKAETKAAALVTWLIVSLIAGIVSCTRAPHRGFDEFPDDHGCIGPPAQNC